MFDKRFFKSLIWFIIIFIYITIAAHSSERMIYVMVLTPVIAGIVMAHIYEE